MMTIDGLPRLLLCVMCYAIQHYVDNMIVRGVSVLETNIEFTYLPSILIFSGELYPTPGGQGVKVDQILQFFPIESLPNVSQWVLVMT